MTWHQRVIWSEGLFLEPQHFQQHDRFIEHLVRAHAQATQAWGWGWVAYAIDRDALGLGKFSLTSASGVLPDGTPFSFPDEACAPPPLDVPADAKDELVMLALPIARQGAKEVDLDGAPNDGSNHASNGMPNGAPDNANYGGADHAANLAGNSAANAAANLAANPAANLAANRAANAARHAALRLAVVDTSIVDNTSVSDRAADVRVASPAIRLMLARDVPDAYVALGVARIVERGADQRVVLDERYVPPLLHALACPALRADAQQLAGLLHQRGDALAARMNQPGRGGVSEISEFLLLQTINRFEPLFAHLLNVPLVHPQQLYRLALALAGDLATFRERRRAPEFPAYRHDDLEATFAPLMAELRRSLSIVLKQSATAIALHDRKFGVRVATIADLELVRHAGFVLAVNAQMPGDTLRVRFPTQAKLGPVDRIRDLVNLQLPGIGLRALPVAPREIPYHAGFCYFELDRNCALWKQLEQTGNLAMHIAGEFPQLELEFWAILP